MREGRDDVMTSINVIILNMKCRDSQQARAQSAGDVEQTIQRAHGELDAVGQGCPGVHQVKVSHEHISLDYVYISSCPTRPNSLNILISSSSLINTLSKLLVLGLAPYFAVDNIYSCAKTSKYSKASIREHNNLFKLFPNLGKEHILNQVLNRFGSNCTYIVVGKSREEYQLTKKVSH